MILTWAYTGLRTGGAVGLPRTSTFPLGDPMLKKIVGIIALSMLSVSAFAADQKVAVLTDVSREVSKLVVMHDGTLRATLAGTTKVIEKSVSKANTARVLEYAQYLSNVETKTVKHVVVCMMMPGPGMNWSLSVAKTDEKGEFIPNSLRLIQNNQGCWVGTATVPTEDFMAEQGREFHQMLVVLANEVVDAQ